MRNRLNSSNTNDVIVGRVRGAWGIHGEVKVESFSDAQNRFSNGKRLFVEGRLAVIQSSRIANKVLIIKSISFVNLAVKRIYSSLLEKKWF